MGTARGQQRKSIIMRGSHVAFVIGWTGLATIGMHNTGDWLHDQLDAMNAPSLPLETIVKTLADSATLHFATLPTNVDKQATFSLGGWFVTPRNTVEPFGCRITNSVIPIGKALPVTSLKFEYGFIARNPKKRQSKHAYVITVTGDERTALKLAGRMISAVDSAHTLNYVTNATYAPQGVIAGFSNGSSITGIQTYNSRLQPLQLYYTNGTAAPVSQIQASTCPTVPGHNPEPPLQLRPGKQR